MVDPAAIRAIIWLIDAAVTLVCNEIDKQAYLNKREGVPGTGGVKTKQRDKNEYTLYFKGSI